MDGVSVAASVAGLLSLGIQVTESLVKFYTAYKHQDADVAATTLKLDNILVVLRSLHAAIQNRKFRTHERELVQEIEKAIQNCDEVIKELQHKYEGFYKDSASGLAGRIRTARRRAAYPFRKGTLQNLEEDIGEIRTNLSFALDILQLNDHKTTQDETSELIAR